MVARGRRTVRFIARVRARHPLMAIRSHVGACVVDGFGGMSFLRDLRVLRGFNVLRELRG
jgi:hypothetical protein